MSLRLGEKSTMSTVNACPYDVLEQEDAELLYKWLSLFVLEVRKGDGTK